MQQKLTEMFQATFRDPEITVTLTKYNRAIDHRKTRQWDKSIADFRMVIKLRPDHPRAYRHLGNLYEYGDGVSRDRVEAFAWYGVAAAGGDGPAVAMRDALGARLDPASLARARARARELFERFGSDPSLGG